MLSTHRMSLASLPAAIYELLRQYIGTSLTLSSSDISISIRATYFSGPQVPRSFIQLGRTLLRMSNLLIVHLFFVAGRSDLENYPSALLLSKTWVMSAQVLIADWNSLMQGLMCSRAQLNQKHESRVVPRWWHLN